MLTEEHWQKILIALPMLATAAGLQPTEETCFGCIRSQWHLLGDEAALSTWIDTQRVANMKASHTHLEAELVKLSAAIVEAETKG